MASFYEGVLGLGRRFEMRIAQASVNRILGLPDDRSFHMVVYKGQGDGLVEVDVHDRELPARASGAGRLPPGNCGLTLEGRGIDAILGRAGGWLKGGPASLAAPPYGGRRAARLEGPSGEQIEILEAE